MADKRCTKCQESKAEANGYCKPCMRAYSAARYRDPRVQAKLKRKREQLKREKKELKESKIRSK